jgi:hypothetical protein
MREKPPGIRVEDLEPWQIVKYIDGELEEVHLILPDSFRRKENGKWVWGSYVPTLKLKGVSLAEEEVVADMLHCEMHAWDYKIEIVDDVAFRLQAFKNIAEWKLVKPRANNNVTDQTKTATKPAATSTSAGS